MKKTENVIDSWKQDRSWLHHNVEQNVSEELCTLMGEEEEEEN